MILISALVHAVRLCVARLWQSRRKQNDVLGEKIKLERSIEKFEIETRELESMEAEREVIQKVLDEKEQRDAVTKYNLAELERTHDDLTNTKDDIAVENAQVVLPELARIEGELESLTAEFKRQGDALEKESRVKDALLERHGGLTEELERSQAELEIQNDLLAKARLEPERMRRQTDSVFKAASQLADDISALVSATGGAKALLEKQVAKRLEVETERVGLARKLESNQAAIDRRAREVEALHRTLDAEKAVQHELATTKLDLELAHRSRGEELHRANEALSSAKKDYDAKKRLLKKKRYVVDGVRELLPTLGAQLVDSEHLQTTFVDANSRVVASIKEARKEVDLQVARFIKQETLEKAKCEDLARGQKAVAAQEIVLSQWQGEERKQSKLLSLLAAQRELKVRATARAAAEEKHTRTELKVKELAVLDLTKKCNDANNRLKALSALFEVVKNERNKYLNLIQASTQALSEMKEKIAVLTAEVEILRGESISKEKSLVKELSAHAMSKAARDSLRLELNKGQQEYRRKQEAVQQQIEEVKALNSIINGHEREMLRLKLRYEAAVAKRNETGVKLIDRNDDLCALFEKSNLQEATLERGDSAVRAREEDVRALKLALADLNRKVVVAMQRQPAGGDLAARARALVEELKEHRARTAELCLKLESPENEERFRLLEGSDPELPVLEAKEAVLEARLDEKKGQILEKELVLEEVSSLTQKLKNRAGDGREGAIKMSTKVNDYQGRIRDVTRRMMATVSELSMYQATAMKLQQEKGALRSALDEAKWRVAHGKAPSDDAEREWFQNEQASLARKEARLLGRSAGAAPPTVAMRTTAEPRPNAYIPDDIGIPKPYGILAPFKPTEAGATMRHIRAPNPAEIEI